MIFIFFFVNILLEISQFINKFIEKILQKRWKIYILFHNIANFSFITIFIHYHSYLNKYFYLNHPSVDYQSYSQAFIITIFDNIF
jgi:hypothetical protein